MRTQRHRVADRRSRWTVGLLMICAVSSANSARAQGTTAALVVPASHPAVDSATVARVAVRDAQRDGRSATNGAPAPTPAQQVALLQRATRAWPTQPAYWQLLVRVARIAADTTVLAEAMRALEWLDVGATAVRPIAVHDVVTLADSSAFVEGLVRDHAPRTLLVTEMRRGTVLRVGADGRTTDLHLDTIAGMSAVWAVRPLPNSTDLLLVTASMPPHQRLHQRSRAMTTAVPAALWQIDARSGAVRDRWPLPDSLATHAPGALFVMTDGTVIISDAATATLYARAPGQEAWASIRHALLRSPQGVVEITPGVLIVADYTHGLLRVEPTSGSVTRLHDAPRGTVLGLDGLALHKGWIFGIQNGLATPRVVAIRLDERATLVQQVRTLWRDPVRLVSPTTIAADDDGLWLVTNTHWDDYDDDGARRAARPLRATSIVRLPWGHADVNSAVAPARTMGSSSTASVPPFSDRSTVNRPRDP